MKALILTAVLLGSLTAHAKTCEPDALGLAQRNLNQVAEKIQVTIDDETAAAKYNAVIAERAELVQKLTKNGEPQLVYSVGGDIYKGSFNIQVTVSADDCSARNITITPIQ